MELDAATLGTVTAIVAGGLKWAFARTDKQFAEFEAKAELARREIKADLEECDKKHQRCEDDRIEILKEVGGLRAKVEAVAKSQGMEIKQQATNTADIQALKEHRADGGQR